MRYPEDSPKPPRMRYADVPPSMPTKDKRGRRFFRDAPAMLLIMEVNALKDSSMLGQDDRDILQRIASQFKHTWDRKRYICVEPETATYLGTVKERLHKSLTAPSYKSLSSSNLDTPLLGDEK